ncbi:hypothetical protein IKD98_03315 [Candidatus Saccharibacteria bacterium]|nr:hypothetical protein [Candidatus Saccharibacteria bacterium]
MFFKKENEFDVMRRELMTYYDKEYAQSCMKCLDDFSERAISSLRSEAVFDDSFVEQSKADSEKALNVALRKIEQISDMSDGDVKQLYYQVFGRWSPVKH